MDFKDRLREEIDFNGLQVKEIAAKVGISYSTFLSYIDSRGVLPNVETAVRIAKVLGVSVEYLVDGIKDANKSDTAEKIILRLPNTCAENNYLSNTIEYYCLIALNTCI